MGKLQRLMIHCTDTPKGREISRKDIEQWHLKERGWSRVGYSDMIHLDGRVENLIPYNFDQVVDPWEISNGARGYNSTTRHVVYVGGKGGDTRTDEQKKALAMYIKAFLFDHPNCEVIGHRDVNSSKTCPNFDVDQFLREIEVCV